MAKKNLEVTITGAIVKKKGARNVDGYAVEIGSRDANFDDTFLTKEMQVVLKQIGSRLITQLKCDAVSFNAISFQCMWNRNKKK